MNVRLSDIWGQTWWPIWVSYQFGLIASKVFDGDWNTAAIRVGVYLIADTLVALGWWIFKNHVRIV